jgi:diacylglycerol kinase (ATP)
VARRLSLEGEAIREIGKDGTARSLAEQAVRERLSVVVVMGGDGTLHQIVQVLAGSNTALGIVPLGTSNDLAGRIAMPPGLRGLEAVMRRPRIQALDLIRIDGVRVATVGGLGLPAHVAQRANQLRARSVLGPAAVALGRSVYAVLAASRILRRGAEATVYSIRMNHGRAVRVSAAAVLVGLVDRFGGGLQFVVPGGIRAGSFAALVTTATTRCSLMRALARIRLGRSIDGLGASHAGLTHVSIRAGDIVGAFGDGEWFGVRRGIEVELEPAALRVLVPGGREPASTVPRSWREAG